jgi:hypothetical protein
MLSHFRPIPQNRDIIYEYPLTETREVNFRGSVRFNYRLNSKSTQLSNNQVFQFFQKFEFYSLCYFQIQRDVKIWILLTASSKTH